MTAPTGLQRTRLDISGHVGVITLHYPDKLNVWGPVMEREVRQHVDGCVADPEVRIIVLTGEGRAFCAGADVDALSQAPAGTRPAAAPPSAGDFEQRFTYLLGVPKLIICGLNGGAAGVGFVLAMFCDLRWAAKASKLAPVFARRGLVAEAGVAWMLPRIVGTGTAIELLASGRTVPAEEAHHLRLVHEILPDEGFRASVIERAQALAAGCSPRAVAIIKRQVYAGLTQSLSEAVRLADNELTQCFATEDFREGVAHFLERREPRFTGR